MIFSLFCNGPVFNIPHNTYGMMSQNTCGIQSVKSGNAYIISLKISNQKDSVPWHMPFRIHYMLLFWLPQSHRDGLPQDIYPHLH